MMIMFGKHKRTLEEGLCFLVLCYYITVLQTRCFIRKIILFLVFLVVKDPISGEGLVLCPHSRRWEAGARARRARGIFITKPPS